MWGQVGALWCVAVLGPVDKTALRYVHCAVLSYQVVCSYYAVFCTLEYNVTFLMHFIDQ